MKKWSLQIRLHYAPNCKTIYLFSFSTATVVGLETVEWDDNSTLIVIIDWLPETDVLDNNGSICWNIR